MWRLLARDMRLGHLLQYRAGKFHDRQLLQRPAGVLKLDVHCHPSAGDRQWQYRLHAAGEQRLVPRDCLAEPDCERALEPLYDHRNRV